MTMYLLYLAMMSGSYYFIMWLVLEPEFDGRAAQ
jgi:hypothetical protein